MNVPFFSVVMPVYDRSSFLNKSICSVLNQDFTDFELICVDDGSKDNSSEIIKRFAEKDKRVKLIRHNKNLGRCAARNSGIKNTAAKWICFLDSDDMYVRTHLSVFYRLISAFPDKNAFATSIETESHTVAENTSPGKEKISVITLKDVIHSNLLPPNVLCYNREKIKITFSDENIPVSEDWLFSRILLTETDIIKTTIKTTVISEHENRTMNTQGIKNIVHWNEYTGLLFASHPKLNKSMSDLVKSRTYLLCANMLISNGAKNESVPFLKKSLPFLRTFLDPLFYKYIIKYVVK